MSFRLANSLMLTEAVNECLDEGLKNGDSLTLEVAGDCMEPVLNDKDSVRIIQQINYLPGDIVAYYSTHEQRRLIHRVLGKMPLYRLVKNRTSSSGKFEPRYLIKADNSIKPDVLVPSSVILGKAVNIEIGLLQRVSSYLTAYYWFAVIVLTKVIGSKVSE